jgi:hypothetical protein
MWSEYLSTLLFALQLDENAFNLKFTSNFRSAIAICNFNNLKHLKPQNPWKSQKNLEPSKLQLLAISNFLDPKFQTLVTQNPKLKT